MIVLRINWNVHLTGPAADENRRCDPAWHAQRRDLFLRYTLPSLQRQTEPDWQAWLRYDPALANLTDPLRVELREPRVRFICDTPAAIRELARTGPRHLVFGRLDSDDLLHPGALARWSREPPGLVQFAYGYALDVRTGRLYEWDHPSSPFIARVGDASMLAGDLPDLGGDHGRVHEIARRIADRRWYMVLLHETNLCNRIDRPWCRREVRGQEKHDLLRDFAISDCH
jgi:hypothetical protein